MMATPLSAYTRPPSAADSVLTVHTLREELARFAEGQLEGRLQELRDSIIIELRQGLAGVTTDIGGTGGVHRWPARGLRPPAPPKSVHAKSVHGCGALSARPAENDARTILTPKGKREGYAQLSQAGQEEGDVGTGADTALLSSSAVDNGGINDVFNGDFWSLLTSSAVMMSALAIGFETDYMARNWREESPHYFRTLDTAFCIFFAIELAIRLGVEGFSFCTGPGRWWNWFDFLVVGLQVFEVVTEMGFIHTDLNSEAAGLSNLRILRVVRIVRLGRICHLMPSLRKLLTSISETVGHIWWPMILILMVTYVYGVVLTQIVTDHKKSISEEKLEHQEELIEFYGTLDRSMLSLFETVSDGIHWGEVAKPLTVYCSPWLTLVFICYVAFVLFAMMNVITAFFVESAMEAAKTEHRNLLARQLWAIFGRQSGSHGITSEEFYEQAEHPQMQNFYEELKLTPEDGAENKLFDLLDADGSGRLEVNELVDGCQRLLGPAKQVDFVLFVRTFKEELEAAKQHRELVEAVFWDHLRPKEIETTHAPFT